MPDMKNIFIFRLIKFNCLIIIIIKGSPMSTRNFPASFWNSNYQPQQQLIPSKNSFMAAAGAAAYGAAGADFYGAVGVGDYGSTLSGLSHHHHQSDPWSHYPLTSHHHHPHHPHHQGYHHRATDLSYPAIPSTSR
jgi:hypothetical protein